MVPLEAVRVTDRVGERSDRARADVRVLDERFLDDVVERGGDRMASAGASLRGRDGILREDREQDRRAVVPVERDVAGDALVRDRGEREDVGPRVERVEPLSLLGRHVVGRADRRAEHRELLGVLVLVLHRAEVEELHDVPLTRTAEEDVVRLQVAVHELARVRLVQTERHLREHAHESRRSHSLFALEREAELFAVEVLHDQEPDIGLLVALEIGDAHDVVVRQVRADLVLALEPRERDLVTRDVVVQHLHGDPRIGLLVDPLVHAPHAAIGDHAADLVATSESRSDPLVLVRGDWHHARRDERCTLDRTESGVVRIRPLARRATLHGVCPRTRGRRDPRFMTRRRRAARSR